MKIKEIENWETRKISEEAKQTAKHKRRKLMARLEV